jgi:hypothetical protein
MRRVESEAYAKMALAGRLSICGKQPGQTVSVRLRGSEGAPFQRPREAARHGCGHVPNRLKGEGIPRNASRRGGRVNLDFPGDLNLAVFCRHDNAPAKTREIAAWDPE